MSKYWQKLRERLRAKKAPQAGNPGDYVLRFGKWAGEPLAEVPCDSLWWLLRNDWLHQETRKAIEAYLRWLLKNPDQGWMPWGEYDGKKLGEIPTWWLQLQLDWVEEGDEVRTLWGVWRIPAVYSPFLRHLMRREVHQRGTDAGVWELREDGSWYEKHDREDRDNDFSPMGEKHSSYLEELPVDAWRHECKKEPMPWWTKVIPDGRRPSAWYLRRDKDVVADELCSDGHSGKRVLLPLGDWEIVVHTKPSPGCDRTKPREERDDWRTAVLPCNAYVDGARERAVEEGGDSAWKRFKNLKARREVVQVWLDTLRVLDERTLAQAEDADELFERWRWAAVCVANIADGDERVVHQLMLQLNQNYALAERRLQEREELAEYRNRKKMFAELYYTKKPRLVGRRGDLKRLRGSKK